MAEPSMAEPSMAELFIAELFIAQPFVAQPFVAQPFMAGKSVASPPGMPFRAVARTVHQVSPPDGTALTGLVEISRARVPSRERLGWSRE
jgi:hypothetical protein